MIYYEWRKHMEYLLQSKKTKTEEKEIKKSRLSGDYMFTASRQQEPHQTSLRYMDQAPVQKIKIQDDKIPDEISSRNNGPKWIGQERENETDLTRHHIIPFKLIRKFFDLAIKEIEAKSIDKMNEWLLASFHTAKDVQAHPGWEKFDPCIETELFSGVSDREISDNTNPISMDALKLLEAAFSWMPGNIFIGPSYRMDDSKAEDEIDASVRYLIGEDRYKLYETTFEAMQEFVKNPATYTTTHPKTHITTNSKLTIALEGLAAIAKQKEPVRYTDTRDAWLKIESKGDVDRLDTLTKGNKIVHKNISAKRKMLRNHEQDASKPNPNYYIPTEYILDNIVGGTELLAVLLNLQKVRVRYEDDERREIGTLCGRQIYAIRKYQTITFYTEDVINGCKQIARSDKRETVRDEIIDLAYAIKQSDG